MSCEGWGIQPWGGGQCNTGPWGSVDVYPPQILHVEPACGTTKVHVNAPIIIKVSDLGCAGLDLDKTRIWVNKFLVYDGSGLTIEVDQEDGFASAYTDCSTFSTEVDPVCGGSIWTIKICGVGFSCDSDIGLSAIFYDKSGNSMAIGSGNGTVNSKCIFSTIPCNYIKSVEILDNSHYVIRFENPMTQSVRLNPLLYDPNSYSIAQVSGGTVIGSAVYIKSIVVEKSISPRTVILETTPATPGAMYEFSGARGILDIYRQTLFSRGLSCAIVRKTKLDSLMHSLPQMYSSVIHTDRGEKYNEISLWQILAPLGIEDEKIGGNY